MITRFYLFQHLLKQIFTAGYDSTAITQCTKLLLRIPLDAAAGHQPDMVCRSQGGPKFPNVPPDAHCVAARLQRNQHPGVADAAP